MSLFLIPVILYGALLFGQRFPKSEAASAGVTLGEMVRTVFAPLMLILLVLHAMVGYVELGTDSWISKITGSIMASPQKGLMLFVYTSTLMFALRFVAGPIVHKISPLGLLFVSGVLGAIGLTLLGNSVGVLMCVIAATVYSMGKTFLWPTMLAVVSERFPKGGAVAIGMMGGAGMLSAGLLGSPAIGYKQDHFATREVQAKAPQTYERYAANEPKGFLFLAKIKGLDGAKVGVLSDDGKELSNVGAALAKEGKADKNYQELASWWSSAKAHAATDKKAIEGEKDPSGKVVSEGAVLYGGRMALKVTAVVPLTMAVLYLLLIFYFKSKGGYKQVHIEGAGQDAKEIA